MQNGRETTKFLDEASSAPTGCACMINSEYIGMGEETQRPAAAKDFIRHSHA